MSSRFGNMQCGLLTAALSCLKSTQILTDPFFFLTGTIGEHQSVGSVVFWIMPFCSIRPSSSFIASASGNGILLGVTMLYGFALSISLIFTSFVFTSPVDPNTLLMLPILLTSPSLEETALLRRLLFNGWSTTTILKEYFCSLYEFP